MYFLRRDGRLHDVTGSSFRDLIDGKLAAMPGERATMSDWHDHLSTLFPDVRLKKVLEMRGADAGPWRKICALPAFWVGLMYEPDVLNAAWDLVRDWTAAEIDGLRAAVPKAGLKAPIRGETVLDVAVRVVDLAEEGLRRRANLSESGADERIYLKTLHETIACRETPAERLLTEYRDEWDGDITQIFSRYAY